MVRSLRPFTPEQVRQAQEKNPNLIILDCRQQSEYVQAHIPGSITIPINGNFAIWTAFLIDGTNKDDKIILVSDPGHEREAITRLARTGIDCIEGFLAGGFEAWTHANYPTASAKEIVYKSSEDFAKQTKDARIIDVRNQGEWDNGVLENADL